MAKEIPVYLFLGFLESGKTKFIQETMEDKRFDTGEKTLLVICEEGEVELEPKKFAVKNTEIVTIESQEELSSLEFYQKKYNAERVLVEYNGMWELGAFFDAMPDGWLINQVMTFFDSQTFLAYNQNMRQLVFDKIQYTQLVVFNRFKEEYGKNEFHKIVRGISRQTDIVYEYTDGKVMPDDIIDPLPYDVNADNIVIEDRDYAIFYRDLVEEGQKYNGKRVTFRAVCAWDKRVPLDTVVVGRHVMQCCANDIQYVALVCKHDKSIQLRTKDWVMLTATITFKFDKIYGKKGPVLMAEKIAKCDPPEEEVATFY